MLALVLVSREKTFQRSDGAQFQVSALVLGNSAYPGVFYFKRGADAIAEAKEIFTLKTRK